jgi:hypothetical protein
MAKKPARKLKTRTVPRLEAKAPVKSGRRVAAVVQTTTIIQSRPPSFKQRLMDLMGRDRRDSSGSTQLAEVREGVMEELRKHGGSEGLAGRPFQNVILPEASKPARRRSLPLWLTTVLTAAAVLAALAWWASRPPAGAEMALHHIEDAIASRNTAAFERLVDTPTLSANIVSQVFTPAQQNADAMMADQFEASVRAHLQNALGNGQNVAPSHGTALADNLHDQMLAAVSAGRWPTDPGNLLGQLWEQLGGEFLKVGRPRVVSSTPTRVEAELPLSRDDIDFDVALRLTLEQAPKKDGGQWQLVDMPNLAQAMGLVDDAEAASADMPATATAASVTADVLQAAKDNRGHVLARLNLANMSGLPVHGLDIALIIGDADGRPLKQVVLHEDTPLAPTQSLEQTYTVALDHSNPHEAIIGKLPLTALTVRANVVGVIQ